MRDDAIRPISVPPGLDGEPGNHPEQLGPGVAPGDGGGGAGAAAKDG
jgi:hypothetical protein